MPHSVSVPVPCGSGLKLVWLPLVVVVVVVVSWNFSCFSFFPEVVVVSVHVTVPLSLVQTVSANAGTAAVTIMAAIMAAVTNKLIRLVILFPFAGYQRRGLVACLPEGRLGVW